MTKTELEFPGGFLWGAATSSHQVEGGNFNDWSEWEKGNAERLAREAETYWQNWQKEKFPEMFKPENYISKKACDHYNRFKKDFKLAKELGHNAHRFSIEWSRIEPEEGEFNQKALDHYREVIEELKALGIKPFVTLWHWTIPLWVRDFGGVESRKFPFYFARFSKYVVEQLGTEVNFWMTLNEPTAVILNSYVQGVWPPQKKSFISAFKVSWNLSRAHRKVYKIIHKISPTAKVGFGNVMTDIEPASRALPDRLAAWFRSFWSNEYFLLLCGNTNDYLAPQYYFHFKIKFPAENRSENKETSDLSWEICPEGIYHILKSLKKYNKPIYITENGLADAGDKKRAAFIKDHLSWIHRAIIEGVDVRGYFHWSLMDNFEWDKGFWPRFGLIEVDYKTLERKPRSSAYFYRGICKTNRVLS